MNETQEKALPYKPGSDLLQLHCFFDSDFSGDHIYRIYTAGMCFYFPKEPSLDAQKPTIVALLSSEMKFAPISTTAREAIWIYELAKPLGVDVNGDMVKHGDNPTSLQMAREARLTEASKNISIHHCFIRDAIELGTISVKYVPM